MSARKTARRIRDDLAARRLQRVEPVEHVHQDLCEVDNGDHGFAVESPEGGFSLGLGASAGLLGQALDLTDRLSEDGPEVGPVVSHALDRIPPRPGVQRFWWWDDALRHAVVLAQGTRLRHRVERDHAAGHWVVTLGEPRPSSPVLEVCS